MSHQALNCSAAHLELLHILANTGLIWLKKPDYQIRQFQLQLPSITLYVPAYAGSICKVLMSLEGRPDGAELTNAILALKAKPVASEQFTAWRSPQFFKVFDRDVITLNHWLKQETAQHLPLASAG